MKLIDNFSTQYKLKVRLPHTFSVILFFSILYTLFFSPVILSKGVLAPGDGIIFYLPAFYSTRTLWTDLIFSGFPAAADPQIQTWYPPSLLFSLIPHSWNAFVISAYVLASCFTYGYVYSLSQSRMAALISGTVYGMSGFMMAHLGHTVIIHAAAWMPLLIWTADRLRHHLSPSWFVVGILAFTCSILAGHPQISFYGLGLTTVYALVLGWSAPIGRWKYYKTYLAVIVLGLGLAAIQIVPTAELSGLGLRSKMRFSQFVSFSLPPEQTTQLLFPFLFGGGGPFRQFYEPPYFGKWNLTEITGYIGIFPLLLSSLGFLAHRSQPIARFWLAASLISLLLAIGNATPLAHLVYHLPVYNKFRAPARHLIEMSFAISVLSGLGVSAIQRKVLSKHSVLKIISVSAGLLSITLAGIFLFSGQLQAKAIAAGSQPLSFAPWTNPAVGVPLVIFGLAIAVLLYSINSTASKFGVLLVLSVVVIDLGSFGWFYEWRYASPSQDVLTPTAAVRSYQEILNQSQQRLLTPKGGTLNFDEIPPNLSRIWGMPSASGYGPLLLSRYSELFPMGAAGDVSGKWASATNRSLDLMSVRYMFIPPWGLTSATTSNQGILWHNEDMTLAMGKDCLIPQSNSVKFNIPAQPKATAIGIVSSLACSKDLPNGAELLRISVTDVGGKVATQKLLAGRDTAEWAYDCSDVKPLMQHQRASIFTSVPHRRPSFPDCERHNYLGVLPLDPVNQVQDVKLEWIGSSGSINIQKLSLIDESTGQSYPITDVSSAMADSARWRRGEDIPGSTPKPLISGSYLGASVYENLRAMPRAWLVPEVVSAKSDQVLEAIQSSRLPDGRIYEPSQVALVEEPLSFKVQNPDSTATVKIIKLSDTQFEVQTDSTSEAFLVLSDIYYPGWQARIDGKSARIFQTNYVLRGVQVPAGKHRIEFQFKPVSFHLGVGISAASLCMLGYLFFKLKKQPKNLIIS